MIDNIFKLLSALAVLSCLVSSSAAQTKISEEKKLLIKELLAVTHSVQNSEGVMNLMSDQIEKETLDMLKPMIESNSSLSASQKAALQKEMMESSKRAAGRMRELFKEKINFGSLIEEISDEIYDAHYSTEELKDLLAFYESPTGQKTIRITPEIMTESMMKTSERLSPQIQGIIKQVVDEEMARFKKQVPPRTSRRKAQG